MNDWLKRLPETVQGILLLGGIVAYYALMGWLETL